MSRIVITGSLPCTTHAPSHCDDFLGLILEAEGPIVKALFTAHPELVRLPDHYTVAMTEAVRVLDTAHRQQAVIYWGNVVREYVLFFPHSCASVID